MARGAGHSTFELVACQHLHVRPPARGGRAVVLLRKTVKTRKQHCNGKGRFHQSSQLVSNTEKQGRAARVLCRERRSMLSALVRRSSLLVVSSPRPLHGREVLTCPV